ncbi:unnamed protein product [Owenia fusiformis]|uniref:Uncharacterized protein n=1 Tax=Owenia fusiformis TaxID=6347 RepID=A0A8J1XS17_OWEFU|nr:unnamed protein product [Owenia fusiformis]
MPEGPELHMASRFVNHVCSDRMFSGAIFKSEVSHKNPEIPWNEKSYTISATSRGKEVKLTLHTMDNKTTKTSKPPKIPKSMDIIFRFGMSGKFQFTSDSPKDIHKHAHLQFFTDGSPKKVLSFVDVRRFGKWEVNGDWGKQRGPCVLFEYDAFRKNVLDNLSTAAFDRPICEAMLNQKFFNGIGNYLRAEILYRLHIPPFVCARDVLEPLKLQGDTKVKSETPDLLAMCNIVPLEVVNLGGKGYDPEGGAEQYSEFSQWLQCYYQPGMSNIADHNKRTMWFSGPPGPMIPKDAKTRATKKRQKKNKVSEEEEEESPIKSKSQNKRVKKEEVDTNSKVTRKTKAASKRRSTSSGPTPAKNKKTQKEENGPGNVRRSRRLKTK